MPTSAEPVLFPDAVTLARQVVNAGFDVHAPGVRAVGSVPRDRPDEFLRIRLSGGVHETMVSENATLLLESYALTATRSRRIIALARAFILAQDGELFGCTSISLPSELPDPLAPTQERYSSMVGVRVRGTVLAPPTTDPA